MERVADKIYTNCFLVRRDEDGRIAKVCLAMKKRGWGEGLWNGSGGKPNESETVEQAAKREVQEELGVDLVDVYKRAEVDWYLKEEKKRVRCFIFVAEKWQNEPTESEEMRPCWFDVEAVPYDQMWKSDREWLAEVLRGRTIKARYTYAKEGGEVVKREILDVEF